MFRNICPRAKHDQLSTPLGSRVQSGPDGGQLQGCMGIGLTFPG